MSDGAYINNAGIAGFREVGVSKEENGQWHFWFRYLPQESGAVTKVLIGFNSPEEIIDVFRLAQEHVTKRIHVGELEPAKRLSDD